MKLKELKINQNYLSLIVSFIILGLVYFFLFSKIPWKMVFSQNLVSGGDTGSHNYVAYYASKIFPKLKWWSPDWYAGFPFLYFYPPFLYYLVALLSKIIPWLIGLKIVTLLGTIFLPLAIFLCLKILGYKFPIPVGGSVLALLYLFQTEFSIYGGNIPSTLAGEFSYSLGFGLFFVFIALLIKSFENNKLWFWTSLILALMVIIHPFSVIVAVLVLFPLLIELLISFIFKRKSDISFFHLFKIYFLAFIISAFWSLPFAMLLPYAAKMNWTKVIKFNEIFPSATALFENLAFLVIIWFLFDWRLIPAKKLKNFYIFVYALLASSIPYFLLNKSSIWNTRFLPFIILSLLIISAIGLGSFYQIFVDGLSKLFRRKKELIINLISGLILIFGSFWFIFYYINSKVNYIPFWFKWNYEGFEAKAEWNKISELNNYLKSLPFGRIMWEYRDEYDKFGTPRILENLPIWTEKPTFEGLLIESSISSYFHFINQAETTKTPTSAVAGFEYPPFNFENGVRHLQLFGAQYFLAYTPEIKNLANQNKYLKKLKDINDFSVYQIENSPLVEAIKEIELKPKTKKWLDESIEWYKKMDFSKFIVFYQNTKEKKTIEAALNKKTEPLNNSVEINSLTDDSLSFRTENLFLPHLVKISYFPGWKVQGAYGPYLISPSFIMVIPFKNQVNLKYHYNSWDKIGMILSSLGIIFFVLNIFFRKFKDSLKKKRPFHFLPNY
ncbi:MAG: hypothetical protein ACP5OX_01915 [Minisyncoccia bacterium]